MRAINLLPNQAAAQATSGFGGKLPFVGSAAVPAIALILIFVGYSSGHSAVSTKQAQLATVNAQVLALAKPAVSVVPTTPPVDTSGLVTERTERLAALQSVIGNEITWDTMLLDVARVLPANVWLTSLTVISPTPADVVVTPLVAPAATTTTAGETPPVAPTPAAAPTPGPIGFTIEGSTYTQADVASLLQRLQLLPTLTNVSLVSATQTPVGTKDTVTFNITATLQPKPVTP
jgi:hypothetical protein